MDERLKRAIAERVVELFQMVPDPCPPSVKQLVADIDTGNSSDVEEEFQQKVARVLADPAIDWDAMQKILEARAPNDLLTRPR